MRHRAKFGGDQSKQKSQFFSICKMAAVRHIGFQFTILTADTAETVKISRRSAICQFFNMAAVGHLGFIGRVFVPSAKGIWYLYRKIWWLESVQKFR